MLLQAKEISDGRGGASFKKAKGKGLVCLKCDAFKDKSVGGPMTFMISVGGRHDGEEHQSPRQVTHNFAESNVCFDHQEWNFQKAVDEISQTFCVSLELLTAGRAK